MNPQEFRTWLEAQPADREFFYGTAMRCPLAQWLTDTRGEQYYVCTISHATQKHGSTRPNPGWMAGFVMTYDLWRGGNKDVALEILDGLVPRTIP